MNRRAGESITTEGRSGWLIRSADRRLGLAVTGDTEEEARERFEAALRRRVALLEEADTPPSGVSPSS